MNDNSRNIIDQNEYLIKYEGFVKRYETAKAELEKSQNEKHQRLAKHDAIGALMFELHERDEIITEFDERLFAVVVEKIAVSEGGVEVVFAGLS